jgi:uncharacterized protein (TIGR02217 family)
MSRFVDVYLSSKIPGYPCYSSPRWSTELVQVDSGAEQVNQRWAHPLNTYVLPEAVRDMDIFNSIRDHWLVMRGPLHTFPWRDPLDFASVPLEAPNLVPMVTGSDQTIGIGDGLETEFQIYKKYQSGTKDYSRKILLPVLSSLIVKVNGSVVTTYTCSRPGGVITFASPPANGHVITCGYLFDVEVRFENDNSFDGVVQSFGLGGFSDITLIETRSC